MAFADSLRDPLNPPSIDTIKSLMDTLETSLDTELIKCIYANCNESHVINTLEEFIIAKHVIKGGTLNADSIIRLSTFLTVTHDNPFASGINMRTQVRFNGLNVMELTGPTYTTAGSYVDAQVIAQNDDNVAKQDVVAFANVTETSNIALGEQHIVAAEHFHNTANDLTIDVRVRFLTAAFEGTSIIHEYTFIELLR